MLGSRQRLEFRGKKEQNTKISLDAVQKTKEADEKGKIKSGCGKI